MNFQWYPGHMTKAKRKMQEDIKLVDLVIEVLDARIPLASRNPDIDDLARGKSRVVLLNKADLADKKETGGWVSYFESRGISVSEINSKNAADIKKIEPAIKRACEAKYERDLKRGIRKRPVRAMIVGIPNVGKSTFINSYAHRAAAKTGNKPGVTKGNQWIRMSGTLELLDTPGILWPKFDDQDVGLRLALTGAIRDEIMNTEELATELIRILEERYPGSLRDFYGLENADANAAEEEPDVLTSSPKKEGETEEGQRDLSREAEILRKIARAKGCVMSGGRPDCLRAAGMLLENFRNGRIGRFSLESAPAE